MNKVKKIIIAVLIVGVSAIYAYGNWPQAVYDVTYDASAVLPTLEEDSTASQEFYCVHDGLSGIRIRFATMNREKYGAYMWSISDVSTKETIAEGEVDTTKFKRNGEYKLTFDRIGKSKGHTYQFRVKAMDVDKTESISLYVSTPQKNAGKVLYDGEEQAGSLMLKQTIRYFNVETFIVCLGILSYLVFFVRFMSKLFR